jgi:hypothetical protein
MINTHKYFNLSYESYGDDVYEYYQYISAQTGSSSFPVYCHSNGCSYLSAGLSMHAEYFNDAVSVAIFLTPFVEKGNTASLPLRSTAAFLPLLSFLDNTLGFGLIFEPNFMSDQLRIICSSLPLLCLAGYVPGFDTNPTLMDLNLVVETASTSGSFDFPLRLYEHIGQNIRDRAFRHFDYGAEENLERYGSEQNPLFPLEEIQVPIALFFSEFDNAVTPADRELLAQDFGDNVIYNEVYPFNHDILVLDIISDRQEVMDDILSVLENY